MTKEQFIYALTACGCLLKDGKTWYEHDELIKCFEDLGLLEQEPVLNKIRAEIEQARYGLINDGLDVALQIIDKYKTESEE